jgi:hypothetical protein
LSEGGSGNDIVGEGIGVGGGTDGLEETAIEAVGEGEVVVVVLVVLEGVGLAAEGGGELRIGVLEADEMRIEDGEVGAETAREVVVGIRIPDLGHQDVDGGLVVRHIQGLVQQQV